MSRRAGESFTIFDVPAEFLHQTLADINHNNRLTKKRFSYYTVAIIRTIYTLILLFLFILGLIAYINSKGADDRVKTSDMMISIYNKMIVNDTINDNETAIADERILVSRDILICENITPYMVSVTHDCDMDVNRMWAAKKTLHEKIVESANQLLKHNSDWDFNQEQNSWWEAHKFAYAEYWYKKE